MIINYLVVGATGIGKTDFAEKLALDNGGEIINADLGQMYTKLNIGVAKPYWQSSPIPQHMFDILTEPVDYTAAEWRKALVKIIAEINARGKPAIIVGGSHFYIQSLLFPPQAMPAIDVKISNTGSGTWQELHAIDPQRAAAIHPHDQYRINRALAIFQATGRKPSEFEPVYNPPWPQHWPYKLIVLSRTSTDLKQRLAQRYDLMIKEGWWLEAQSIKGTCWQKFVCKKGFIGYQELMAAPNGICVKDVIVQKTWQYARQQQKFIKALICKLENQDSKAQIVLNDFKVAPIK
jgi:tRNA dimethylallyltransferase